MDGGSRENFKERGKSKKERRKERKREIKKERGGGREKRGVGETKCYLFFGVRKFLFGDILFNNIQVYFLPFFIFFSLMSTGRGWH